MTVSTVRHPPGLAPDPALPGAADLLSGDGAERVACFLSDRGLEPHRVEPAQAHYRPGRSLLVCYRAAAVDRTTGHPLTPTVTAECRPGEPIAMWAFPDDPSLPGLPAAGDAELVSRRLRPRPEAVELEPLRYRPRRRAVLRYRTADGLLFGKVVAPRKARRMLALADALHRFSPPGLRLALPLGKVAPGALVLPPVPGTSLRDLLLTGRPLPTPEQLARLPQALHQQCFPAGSANTEDSSGRRQVEPTTALAAARVVSRLLPGTGCTAARIAEAVIASEEAAEPPEQWIVHGDLYENQIMVDGNHLGLLDLDDLGPGDPLLDAANFTAHLLLLGTSRNPAGPRILRYRDDLRAALCRELDADPAALRWREAYCLLRLTTGPFRVLHPDWPNRMTARLNLAAQALQYQPA